MILTFYPHSRDKATDTCRAASWPEVVELLTKHTRRPEKEGPGFSPVAFRKGGCSCAKTNKEGVTVCPGARGHSTSQNVEQVHMLGIDMDKSATGGDLGQAEAVQALGRIQATGHAAIYHSTHSYAPPEKSTWRVFFALSRPATRDEFKPLWRAAIQYLGIPTGIKTDFPARFWYLPSCPEGTEPEAGHFPGVPLDVDALLKDYVPAEPKAPTEPVPHDYPPASEELLRHVCRRLQEHGPHVMGTSDDAHTFIAGAMLTNDFALAYGEAWPLLVAWNQKNVPPWDEEKLLNKLTVQPSDEHPYGQARHAFEFLARLQAPPEPGDTFPHELVQARADLAEALGKEAIVATPTPFFSAASDLVRQNFPATPWQVRGLITQHALGVFAGEPKCCKSWAALETGIAVSTGTKVFEEFVTTRGPVAYFFAEDQAAAVKTRLKSLTKGRNVSLDDLHVCPRGRDLDLCNDESLAILLASARRVKGLSLLILDPFRDVHTGVEDSSDEMAKVMRRLRILATLLECTVLFVHHSAKAGADVNARRGGQKMRGSGVVHASCDFGMYFSGLSGDGETQFINRIDSEVKAGRSAGAFNLTLDLEDDAQGQATDATWTITRGAIGAEGDESITEIVETIGQCELRQESPPTAKEILKVVKGAKAGLDRNLTITCEAGYVEKHMVGLVQRGWKLTHTGKRLFQEITGRGPA